MLSIAACQTTTTTGEINSPPSSFVEKWQAAGQPYQLTTSTEQVREGLTSQRFELRHGDCGGDDCDRDRQRIQVLDDSVQVGEQAWYGWSVYLDENFPSFGFRTVSMIAEAKLPKWGPPLWEIGTEGNQVKFRHSPRGAYDPIDCRTGSIDSMRGKWTDMVVFADYSTEYTGQHTVKIWINGRLMCTAQQPLITEKMLEVTGGKHTQFRYGLYNAYFSRWLNRNKTKEVDVTPYNDIDVNGVGSTMSITARPFEVDWGVEIPPSIAYYDVVKIGETREEVDIRTD